MSWWQPRMLKWIMLLPRQKRWMQTFPLSNKLASAHVFCCGQGNSNFFLAEFLYYAFFSPPWVKSVYKAFVEQEEQCFPVPGTILSSVGRNPLWSLWDRYYHLSVTGDKTDLRRVSHFLKVTELSSGIQAWLLSCLIGKQFCNLVFLFVPLKCIKCFLGGLSRPRHVESTQPCFWIMISRLVVRTWEFIPKSQEAVSPGELTVPFRECELFFFFSFT